MLKSLEQLIQENPTRWETVPILKKTAVASRHLAELKGISATVPNPAILINCLAMQEAKDSSAIENIITTHDELYKGTLFPGTALNNSTKEVRDYVQALRKGYDLVRKRPLITANDLKEVQQSLEGNSAGFRRLPGTELKNNRNETVYVPPQEPAEIVRLMRDLEMFINDDSMLETDPLVKMAILHHQFESIHPFYDGNGRTGRILNVLYLVQKELLDFPVLYLSRYIVQTKGEYYRLLQNVRETGEWEEWTLYILDAVAVTAQQTIGTITEIQAALQDYKRRIRAKHRFYSQDLINSLFMYPYTKIEFVEEDLNISRPTATRYLELLSDDGFLEKQRVGRSNYYVNTALYAILTQGEDDSRL